MRVFLERFISPQPHHLPGEGGNFVLHGLSKPGGKVRCRLIPLLLGVPGIAPHIRNQKHPDPCYAPAVPGGFNASWYCDPKVDRLANQLKSMTNRTARLTQYPKLDRMMMEDAPVVPVFNPVKYELRSAALKTYAYSPVWWYSLADMAKS